MGYKRTEAQLWARSASNAAPTAYCSCGGPFTSAMACAATKVPEPCWAPEQATLHANRRPNSDTGTWMGGALIGICESKEQAQEQ